MSVKSLRIISIILNIMLVACNAAIIILKLKSAKEIANIVTLKDLKS